MRVIAGGIQTKAHREKAMNKYQPTRTARIKSLEVRLKAAREDAETLNAKSLQEAIDKALKELEILNDTVCFESH